MMDIGNLIYDKYIIIDEIGGGGMGKVLKVIGKDSREEFALKYCIETDEASIRRFSREIRIMAQTIHPNIIQVLEYDIDARPPYFTMPIAKASVSKIIPKIKGDFVQVIKVFNEICKGIAAMHSTNHFHRDIKPSNALIMPDGKIVVSDFGLAKMLIKDSSSHFSSENFLGTFGYHAPEQIEAKNADARTDVFQLGKTLYVLFTNDQPFLINSTKITPGLNYIIQKATYLDPDDRFQTVGELQQAIYTFQLSLDPNTNPEEAFTSKLTETNSLLKQGHYDNKNCIGLLDILNKVKGDFNLFLILFDRIPTPILKIFSNELSDQFESTLKLYVKSVKEYLKSNSVSFVYAEDIASRMSIIFNSTTRLDFKVAALLTIMTAAVECNRFNAMDTFNNLLQSIKQNDVAAAMSNMLKVEIKLYANLYEGAPKNKIHPLILPVWEQAEKIKLEEREKNQIEDTDWLTGL